MDYLIANSEPSPTQVTQAARAAQQAIILFLQQKTSGGEVIRTAKRLVEVMDAHKTESSLRG